MIPRVTFVVPCYNYGRYVAQAIDSLLGQTLREIEVIAIDDASADETPDVLSRYRSDGRVRVIRHPQNRGHIRTYNEGLALARGEFVGLLSADDYCLSRDAIQRQVSVFDANPTVGMVYTAHAFLEGKAITSYAIPFPEDYVRKGLVEFRSLMWADHVPASGTLVRREVQDELGPYEVRLPHSGDWDMWLRAAARHDIGYVAQPMFAYRMHEANMCHSKVSPSQAIDEVLFTLERAFTSLPSDAPADILDAKRAVIEHGLLQTAWTDLFHGRRRRVWEGVGHALKRRPRLAISGSLWRFASRAVLMTIVGRERSRIIGVRLERLRGRAIAAGTPA